MTDRVPRALLLLFVLACFWLALSGFLKPLLLALGAASCLVVVWITLRKNLTDDESLLTKLYWGRWVRYLLWLAVQIVKSTIDVSARILDPRLPISPVVDNVPAELTDLGKVIYANSITLTPGTVSINLTDDWIVVHSLTREGMEELRSGGMYRRIRQLERHPRSC